MEEQAKAIAATHIEAEPDRKNATFKEYCALRGAQKILGILMDLDLEEIQATEEQERELKESYGK